GVGVAGESAGGIWSAALRVATTKRGREPWAQAAWETGLVPSACMPFCALLEVSRPERFSAFLPWWIVGMLRRTTTSYLQARDHGDTIDLADPLVVLERGDAFQRPLPAFFAPVGTLDPVI